MLNIDFTGAPAEKNSGRPATEVVRVIDVILDDTHPMYKDLGETLSLNSILYRPISDSVDLTDEGDTEYTGQAFPLDPNIKTLPLKNETVLLVRGPNRNFSNSGENDIAYYVSLVSIFNHPHINAYPVFDDPGSEVNIGEGIDFIETNAPLQSFPGDTLIEGRLGQSMRLSGGMSEKNPFTNEDNKNKPFIFISNGITNTNQNENGFEPILEDIDKDPSSIYLTSDHTIPLTLANRKRDSYDNKPDEPSKYKGNQVLINAGRLVFNAKKDDILLSSINSVGLNSKTLNLDGKDFVCLDAEKIYLGSRARSGQGTAKQPVMKGHEVERYLQSLIDIISILSRSMIGASNGGGPIPAINTAGANATSQLKAIRSLINPNGKSNLKSLKTFVE